MTKFMIGGFVPFIHTEKNGKPVILRGKIKEKLKNDCLLLEIVNDDSKHSMTGTLCNRSISKVVYD